MSIDEPALAALARIGVEVRIGVTGHRWIGRPTPFVQAKVATTRRNHGDAAVWFVNANLHEPELP